MRGRGFKGRNFNKLSRSKREQLYYEQRQSDRKRLAVKRCRDWDFEF